MALSIESPSTISPSLTSAGSWARIAAVSIDPAWVNSISSGNSPLVITCDSATITRKGSFCWARSAPSRIAVELPSCQLTTMTLTTPALAKPSQTSTISVGQSVRADAQRSRPGKVIRRHAYRGDRHHRGFQTLADAKGNGEGGPGIRAQGKMTTMLLDAAGHQHGRSPTQRLLRLGLGHVGEKHVLAAQVSVSDSDRQGLCTNGCSDTSHRSDWAVSSGRARSSP